MKKKLEEERTARCAECGKIVPGYDVVNLGSVEMGYRRLCGKCFSTEMAELGGVEGFEHVQFEPVRIADFAGKSHEFHFRTRLFGPGVSLEAFELRKGSPAGYQFQIIGSPGDDPLKLLGRLIEKMRRSLSVKHLEKGEFGLQISKPGIVQGKVEWDEAEDGLVPILNIDGQEITWSQFGRMLMSYEGWQFKLEIRDNSEDF